jgi:hypothetical protein
MSSYPDEASVLRAVVNVSRVSVDGIARMVSEDRLSKAELLEELRILALALSPQMAERMTRMPMPAPMQDRALPLSPAIDEM